MTKSRLKAELVETAERGQVRGHERRVVQVEVFRRMVSVRTSILEDLDAYPRTSRRSRATPSTAKSPVSSRFVKPESREHADSCPL